MPTLFVSSPSWRSVMVQIQFGLVSRIEAAIKEWEVLFPGSMPREVDGEKELRALEQEIENEKAMRACDDARQAAAEVAGGKCGFESEVKEVHMSEKVILVKWAGREHPVRVPWGERHRLRRVPGGTLVNSPVDNKWGPVENVMEHLCPEGATVYDGPVAGFKPFWAERLKGLVVKAYVMPRVGRDGTLEVWKAAIEEIVRDSKTNAAWLRDGRVMVASGCGEGWLKPWDMEVEAGAKTDKRLVGVLGRLWRFQRSFGSLKLGFIKGKQELHDGLFYISERLARWVIESALLEAVRAREAAGGKGGEKELRKAKLEYRKVVAYVGRIKKGKCRLFNSRVLVPVGTPGCEEGGQIKGNCVVVKSLPGGVDILTHGSNVKTETRGFKEWVVGLDPRPPVKHVRTNLQVLLFLPGLVPVEQIQEVIKDEVRDTYLRVKSGEMVDGFEELLAMQEQDYYHDDWFREGEDLKTANLRDRWALFSMWKSGVDYRTSPNMVDKAFHGRMRTLCNRRTGRIRVKIPCATEEQVISLSSALVFEPGLKVKEGDLRRLGKWGLSVVGDETWERMIGNHGGCDLDDHFCLLARVVRGRKCWVVFRNPVGPCEYSVLGYVEGDEYPVTEYKGFQGTKKYEWPEADLGRMGEPMGDQVAGGKVRVIPIPEGGKEKGGKYTQDWVVKNLDRLLAGTNPGKFINAMLMMGMVCGDYLVENLVEVFGGVHQLEKVVDAATQGGCVEALEMISGAADVIIQAASKLSHQMGYYGVDPYFLEKRQIRFGPKDVLPREEKNWYSELFEFCEEEIKKAWAPEDKAKRLRAWAQEVHQMPEAVRGVVFHDEAEHRELRKVLQGTRARLAILNDELKERRKKEYVGLEEEMKLKEEIYLACFGQVGAERVARFAHLVHEVRTSKTKEISDALLFTKPFLSHYLEVLRNGKVTEEEEVNLDELFGM